MFPLAFQSNPPWDETAEMILLALARAEENAVPLTRDDLARELNASLAPHLQSLISQALVSVDAGTLALTPAGRARARVLLRRHRVVERHLTDVLGLDWSRAHEQADRLEHTVSAEEEATLAAQLGDPATCPHGNPIPDAPADSARARETPLTACAAATRVIIARISRETPEALRHLATLGLLPEVQVEVENIAPFGGPVMVRLGRAHYALGRDLAARIWIKEDQNPKSQLTFNSVGNLGLGF